jgi:hypothetical protein
MWYVANRIENEGQLLTAPVLDPHDRDFPDVHFVSQLLAVCVDVSADATALRLATVIADWVTASETDLEAAIKLICMDVSVTSLVAQQIPVDQLELILPIADAMEFSVDTPQGDNVRTLHQVVSQSYADDKDL